MTGTETILLPADKTSSEPHKTTQVSDVTS